MKESTQKRTGLALAILGGVVLIALVGMAVFFRLRSPGDIRFYWHMSCNRFSPVWSAFVLRRVQEGSALEDFLRLYPATQRQEAPSSTRLYYRTIGYELCVTAKDGRLVSAKARTWTCSWERTFFDLRD